ncbi:MAG: DUF1801 domain-containing protein [Roseivirga sp.]
MTDFATVDEYIGSFSGNTQLYLQELRAIIMEAAPNCNELINYNIASFALVAGGKRDAQIMMAGYQKHVGLYPHPTTIEYFWDHLKGYKKAKGSVQFPLTRPLPKELISRMMKYRLSLLQDV